MGADEGRRHSLHGARGRPHAIFWGVLCRSASMRRRKALQEGTRKSRQRSRFRARFRLVSRLVGWCVAAACGSTASCTQLQNSVRCFLPCLAPSLPSAVLLSRRLSAPSILTCLPAHAHGGTRSAHTGAASVHRPLVPPTDCPPLPSGPAHPPAHPTPTRPLVPAAAVRTSRPSWRCAALRSARYSQRPCLPIRHVLLAPSIPVYSRCRSTLSLIPELPSRELSGTAGTLTGRWGC
jgi:hypothetical protein